MKVVITYDKFNTDIEEAQVVIDDSSSFTMKVEEGADPTTDSNMLEIKAVNELTSEEITLKMTPDETRQFNLLLTQMIKQMHSTGK